MRLLTSRQTSSRACDVTRRKKQPILDGRNKHYLQPSKLHCENVCWLLCNFATGGLNELKICSRILTDNCSVLSEKSTAEFKQVNGRFGSYVKAIGCVSGQLIVQS
jgi:hypothetical protein